MIQPKKYQLLVYLHPIKNFNTAKIIHPAAKAGSWFGTKLPDGTTIVCPFSIDSKGEPISQKDAHLADPNMVIGNIKDKAWKTICAVAEQSYEVSPRNKIRIDVAIEVDHSGSNANVKRLSLMSFKDNRLFFFDDYAPPAVGPIWS